MILRSIHFVILVLVLALAGCATPPSRFRQEAVAAFSDAGREGYATLLPDGYRQMQAEFSAGERLFESGEVTEADQRYEEVLRHGQQLKQHLAELVAREESVRAEEAARKKADEQKLEEEKERLRRQLEEQQAVLKQAPSPPPPSPPSPMEREPARPPTYTVKRGETLPQIAARPMVYGDPLLWPLIYRANRDQIRDPRRLWPGQILRIPRAASKEEMAEARRFAQGKQMP